MHNNGDTEGRIGELATERLLSNMTTPNSSASATDSKAFILGLDGVPWYLIEEWAEEGHLPNFARILEEGTTGPLRSTTPASTPLAWPSISTGVWPDKHGIYSFQRLTENHTHEMYTNRDVKQPPLWELVSPATVCNVPMTYPASEIDGQLVSGVMAPEMNEKYTYPPELTDEIRAAVPDHKISLKWGEYLGEEQAFVDDITELVEARRQLMEFLLDRNDDWRLFFFTFMEPDRLQHLVWDHDVLREHYRQIDEIVGDVLDTVEAADANLFIVSDHGFGPISKNVCVNNILESEEYLKRPEKSGTRGLFERLGITKSGLRNMLDTVGLDEYTLVKKYLPRSVVDALASNVPGSHSVYDLDHENTEAVVHEFGNVYINDEERFTKGCVPVEEVAPLKRELRSLFESCTDPETGERVLEVYDGDHVFPTDSRSPDLVLEPAPDYEVSTKLSSETFEEPKADAAHRKNGIFMAWGPDIEANHHVDDSAVVDVAPTVLHSLGEPVPSNADGSVLEVFRPDSGPAESEIRTNDQSHRGDETKCDSAAQDDDEAELGAVKERLQGLGYMEE